MSVSFKVKLGNEMRKMSFPQNQLSISLLMDKCRERFPEKLQNTKFVFSYVDTEGDTITFDSQEELVELNKDRKNLNVLFLSIVIRGPSQKNEEPSVARFHGHHDTPCGRLNQHPHPPCIGRRLNRCFTQKGLVNEKSDGKVQHRGVVCDICAKAVVGVRYKCSSCEDFDVCEDCEKKERTQEIPSHSKQRHLYLMIKEPLLLRESLPFAAARNSNNSTSNGEGWLFGVLESSSQEKLKEEQSVLKDIICDGCNKKITNERFKCCLCEDFDLCSECIQHSELKHSVQGKQQQHPLHHPQQHCVWLKVVPLSFGTEELPRLSSDTWNRELLSQFGPFLVPTRAVETFLLAKLQMKKQFLNQMFGVGQQQQQQQQQDFCSNSRPESQQVLAQEPLIQEPRVENGEPFEKENNQPESGQGEQKTNESTSSEESEEEGVALNDEEKELLKKLKELEEMGFADAATNLSLLKIFDGRMDSTINQLLKEKELSHSR